MGIQQTEYTKVRITVGFKVMLPLQGGRNNKVTKRKYILIEKQVYEK